MEKITLAGAIPASEYQRIRQGKNNVSTTIDSDDYQRLRLAAFNAGLSVAMYLRQMIVAVVRERVSEPGAPK